MVTSNNSAFETTDRSILDRAQSVSMLHLPVYRVIQRDPKATKEAAIVVAVVAVASAIGNVGDEGSRILVSLIGAFLGWLVLSGMTYFFGTNIFGTPTTQVNMESLLRTLGYAQAPGVLAIFGIIPLFGWMLVLVGGLWSVVTAVVAIRETLHLSTLRAVLIAILAVIATTLVTGILGLLLGLNVTSGSLL